MTRNKPPRTAAVLDRVKPDIERLWAVKVHAASGLINAQALPPCVLPLSGVEQGRKLDMVQRWALARTTHALSTANPARPMRSRRWGQDAAEADRRVDLALWRMIQADCELAL